MTVNPRLAVLSWLVLAAVCAGCPTRRNTFYVHTAEPTGPSCVEAIVAVATEWANANALQSDSFNEESEPPRLTATYVLPGERAYVWLGYRRSEDRGYLELNLTAYGRTRGDPWWRETVQAYELEDVWERLQDACDGS